MMATMIIMVTIFEIMRMRMIIIRNNMITIVTVVMKMKLMVMMTILEIVNK